MSAEQATPIVPLAFAGALKAIAENMPLLWSGVLGKSWTPEEEAVWQAIDDLKPEQLLQIPGPKLEPKLETWRDRPPML